MLQDRVCGKGITDTMEAPKMEYIPPKGTLISPHAPLWRPRRSRKVTVRTLVRRPPQKVGRFNNIIYILIGTSKRVPYLPFASKPFFLK
jgi:hypothetical protein